MSKLFETSEVEGKSGADLQQAAQLIKQRFDQKRNFYHQMRNQYFNVEHWDELNTKVNEFDANSFNTWNQEWSNIHRANDLAQIVQYFNNGTMFYEEMDKYISSITQNQNNSPEVEALKNDVMGRIESDVLSLKLDVASDINKGIQNVLDLKAELGLEKNFGENITNELKESKKFRDKFMQSFLFTLLLIPIFLFIYFYLEYFKSLKDVEVYSLRIGITLSLGFMSYFCYSQYKLYQLISLRYIHLSGFLGGGATFIKQLIGTDDPNVTKEINTKMAGLFMDLDDVFGLVKKNNHPAEITVEKLNKILETISKLKN